MIETLSADELAIGQQVRALADAGVVVRDPDAVVQAAIHRSPRRGFMRLPVASAASAGVLLLVAVFAVSSLGQMGSSPVTAHIGGSPSPALTSVG